MTAPPNTHRTPLRTNHGRITLVFYNKPRACGGACIFCILQPGFTKSTVSNEDTLLAKDCDWDSRCQIETRFRRYGLALSRGNKYDFRVKGDTFTKHDPEYLEKYFKGLYDFLNGDVSADFETARRLHRDAPDRCCWIQVETRPDYITEQWCDILARLGVNTVELGVQSLDDNVLDTNQRGHGVAEVEHATTMLRQRGFEVGYHMMVGLPGSSDPLDFEVLTERLWNPSFSPDCLKIYPCILMRDGHLQPQLVRWRNDPRWKPQDDDRYLRFLHEVLPRMPRTVHINRLQRIMSPRDVAVGPSAIIDRSQFDGISNCLWQRSLPHTRYPLHGDFSDYRIQAIADGSGYTVEATVDADKVVLGYGRLTPVLDTALVRDLRLLGDMLPLGARGAGPQHMGIGTAMLSEMERVARQHGCTTLRALAPPGVLRYLESRGFRLTDPTFVEKDLSPDGPTTRKGHS